MGYRYDSDVLPEEDTDENFILRHWRGHLSLPMSWFLVGGIFSAVALQLLAFGTMAIQSRASSLRVVASALLAYFFLFLVVRTWAAVGIWRSAGNHVSRGGQAGWALLARALLVVGVLASLAQARSYGLITLEYGKLASGSDALGKPAEIKVSGDGTEVSITGALASGTAARFLETMAQNPSADTILLDSRGGRIFEAQRIADFVKERQLDTSVQSNCESACTLILLAGNARTADASAQIGFHQPDFPGITEDMRRDAISENTRQYIAAGMSPEFVNRMMQTPASSMWYPDHEDLVREHVLNGESFTVGGPDELAKKLTSAAAEVNQSAPIKLDNVTSLVSAEARGHELILVHAITVPVTPGRMPLVREAMRKELNPADTCARPGVRPLIMAGGSFVYRYTSSFGGQLFDIRISDCG